jgi:hypothetical protein
MEGDTAGTGIKSDTSGTWITASSIVGSSAVPINGDQLRARQDASGLAKHGAGLFYADDRI